MAKWQKAPDWLKDVLEQVLDGLPAEVERRQMFGFPCAFINKNMFIGLFEDSMMMRFSESDRKELIDNHEAEQFEPMPGRPMKEYINIPHDWLEDDLATLKDWAQKSYGYAKSLPPKKKK